MDTFQRLLESAITEHLDHGVLVAQIIGRKLAAQGLDLSEQQLVSLAEHLQDYDGREITLIIDDLQVSFDQPTDMTGHDTDHLTLNLDDEDLDALLVEVREQIVELILETTAESAKQLASKLKRDAPTMVKHRRKVQQAFEERLLRVWHKPLLLLEAFIHVAYEAGDDFNSEFRHIASKESDYRFEALTRLHARACQVSLEILTLLRAGYADGAHARWRALHEIAVVAFLIASAEEDIAERYLLHHEVESRKAARRYQEYCARLGLEPLSDAELSQIEEVNRMLIERFGKEYSEDYGWAAPLLGRSKPSFADIEKYVGLDHLRPYYQLASYNVHANPRGVFFRLGLYENQDTLLAGPSNFGFSDPGSDAALSLGQVTIALLCSNPDLDRLVTCNALLDLIEQIGAEFVAVQNSLEQAELNKLLENSPLDK